jgi:hypothetical protein
MEWTGRRERRSKQLLENFKNNIRYWKIYVALCGELDLEEAMIRSQDRIRNKQINIYTYIYIFMQTPCCFLYSTK